MMVTAETLHHQRVLPRKVKGEGKVCAW